MFSLKTIDVAIGVVLLYLLLTFAAATLLEMFSVIRNWRAQMLHDAIGNMLQHSSLASVDDIYDHPQILALCRNDAAFSWIDVVERFGWTPKHGGTPPSYIPPTNFSGAVLETVLSHAAHGFELSPEGVVKALQHLLNNKADNLQNGHADATKPCKDDALRSLLRTTLATQGASIQAIRFAIEKWFNDTMDRASGWYKRRTQCCLLAIGLAIAYGGNVTTIAVARWLWQSDSARQAVVAAATDMVARGAGRPSQASGSETPPQSGVPSNSSNAGQGSQPSKASPPSPSELADKIVEIDRKIVDLQYPVGWQAAYLNNATKLSWLPEYIVCGLLTAIAISMGSTFWFDSLQNLIRIRGAGPKPSTR